MKNFLIFVFTCCSLVGFTQNQQIDLDWVDRENVSSDSEDLILIPSFNPTYRYYDLNSKKLKYVRSFEGAEFYEITNPIFENINADLLDNIEVNTEELTYNFSIGYARGKAMTILELNPFIKVNNNIQRLVSFTLKKLSAKPNTYIENKSQDAVPSIQNSVLATGKWRKFYVEETGIHRIDFNFLRDLGFTADEINPNTLKIYGHGGQMLPLVNADTPEHFFDLPEIPLQLNTSSPNTLNQGDDIYFYAEATEGIYSQENETHLNLYADRAYYYVTFNGGSGKRIAAAVEPNGNPSQTINTFNDERYYEVDETSLSLVGRRWFGDRFDITTQRSYNFNFPNLVTTEPIQLRILLGGIAINTTSMSIGFNGELVGSTSIFSTGRDLPSRGAAFNTVVNSNSDDITVSLSYNKQGNPAARGFLDYIRLEAVRELRGTGQQFKFQKNSVTGQIGVAEYVISNADEISQVWDITDMHQVTSYVNSGSLNTFSFKANLGELRRYQTFVASDIFRPKIDRSARNVTNQNLKGNIFNNTQGQFEDLDYLVIAHPK